MNKIFKFHNWGGQGAAKISLRCPSCRKLAIWESNPSDISVQEMGVNPAQIYHAGHRCCPNPSCHAHIFVIHSSGTVLVSYPPETVDFDTSDIPPTITTAFEEAITCHSTHCFTAAAIMVRKTLEQLCRERGAKGSNLKERIKDLGSKVVLPKELLEGIDDIRLLGNDAAHVESQEYNQIGQQELDVAIEFSKEVLKAVFQYSSLLDKLRALKKPTV